MNSKKCSQCGLVNFADAGVCKRCGEPFTVAATGDTTPHTWANAHAARLCPVCQSQMVGQDCTVCRATVGHHPADDGDDGQGRFHSFGGRKVSIAVAVLLVAGGFFAAQRFFGPEREFAKLLRNSEHFKKPLTVTVNQRPIRESIGPPLSPLTPSDRLVSRGRMNPEGYVLEAIGILRLSTTVADITYTEKPSPRMPPNYCPPPLYICGNVPAPKEREPVTSVIGRQETLHIELTSAGQIESADWETFEGKEMIGDYPYENTWWHVPIGGKEFVGFKFIEPETRMVNGKEVQTVYFLWRWKPNKIGEAFDASHPAHQSLPEKVRLYAKVIWDSSKDLLGQAKLERVSNGWRVAEVDYFPQSGENFYIQKSLPLDAEGNLIIPGSGG